MPAWKEVAVGRGKRAYNLFSLSFLAIIIFLAQDAHNKPNLLFAQVFVDRDIYCSHGRWRRKNRASVLCSSVLWAVACRKSINNSSGKTYLAAAYYLKRRACRCVGLGQGAPAQRSSSSRREGCSGPACLFLREGWKKGRKAGHRAWSLLGRWGWGAPAARALSGEQEEQAGGVGSSAGEPGGRVWAARCRQGQQGPPEPPGLEEGHMAERDPGAPQPCPRAPPEPEAPRRGRCRGWAFLSAEMARRGLRARARVEAGQLAVTWGCGAFGSSCRKRTAVFWGASAPWAFSWAGVRVWVLVERGGAAAGSTVDWPSSALLLLWLLCPLTEMRE